MFQSDHYAVPKYPIHPSATCSVCVCTICIDVKLHYTARGMAAVSLAMPTKLWDSAGRECGRTFLHLQFKYHIVPPLGAYKSQLGGTYIFYRCCFIWSTSTVIIRLYFFMNIHSSCQLIVCVFAHPMHSTSEFAMTVLSKCVCVYVSNSPLDNPGYAWTCSLNGQQ